MSAESVVSKIKEMGHRVTPQRALVVRLLHELSHPTADQIYSVMHKQFPYVSPATVYNTLKLLKELGLVAELAQPNRVSQFEVTLKEHWHFHCKVCGQIRDIEAGEVNVVPLMEKLEGAYEVDRFRIDLYGTCPDCRDRAH